MNEEELVKKLESINLSKIEVQSHRYRLRMALLQSGYFKEYPKGGIIKSIMAMISGWLFVRKPVWQTSLVTTLAVFMILGSVMIGLLLTRQAQSDVQPDWVKHMGDFEGPNIFYNSLVFDPSGNPAVSYWDSSTQGLVFARWNGSSWQNETVDAGSGASLAFDSSGNPAIAYRSYLADILKYAFWDGSSWVILTVDFGRVQDVSLQFDSSDEPVISYLGVSSNDVKNARWNGQSWDIQSS